MTASASAPIKHPDRFFIDGSWAAASSATKIDVINSATEELFVRVAEAQAGRRRPRRRRGAQGLRPRPVAAHDPRRAREVSARDRERARASAPTISRRSGRRSPASSTASRRAARRAIGGIYEYYAGLADTFPFEEQRKPGLGERQRRPARARAGRRRRRDHSLERAGFADRLQVRARAARGLHGDPEVLARGARRGLRARGGLRGDRPARRRAQRPHGRPRGLGAARPPPRRRQGDLHRLDGRGAPDRLDLRRAHRALHARARRQVGRRDPRRLRHRQGGRRRSRATRRSSPARSARRSRASS